MVLLNGCLGTNRLINLIATLLSSELWYSNKNGMVIISYEVWQRLSNNVPVYFAHYAGIMLDAFGLLCFLLCWHNRPGPSVMYT